MTRALVVIAVLIHVGLLATLWGGFTDDGFIHVRYADNLITRGEYSFNPGEVSFGTTSPLWVMLLAAIGKVTGGGESLIAISRTLSWLAGVVAVLLVFVLARRAGVRDIGAGFCAITFAAHVWFFRWTALGMETSTAVLAMTAVGIFSIRAHDDTRSAMLLGFFCAVAALVRPEAYLLLPLVAATWVVNGGRPPLRATLATLFIAGLLLVPWLLFAKLHIGHFLPNTAGAKSGGLVTNPVVFLRKLSPIIKIVLSAEAVAVGFIFSALLLLRGRTRVLARRQRFMLMWIVALPVAYVLFDIQVLSRYMLLTSPFTVVLGFLALDDLALQRKRRATGVFALVAALSVCLNLVMYFSVVMKPTRAFSHDLTHELKGLAQFINQHSADDAVVAAADIGYLSFYSRRTVLDLGGLVDDVTSELREAHSYEEIIQQGLYLRLAKYPHVDYFIDRELQPNRFEGRVLAGYRFEPIKVVVIDNLGIRKPGPYYYTLYRLDRDG